VFQQVGDGGGVVDDRRGDGHARLRHQFPDKLPVEAGEGKAMLRVWPLCSILKIVSAVNVSAALNYCVQDTAARIPLPSDR
jgi:hypothetical protein